MGFLVEKLSLPRSVNIFGSSNGEGRTALPSHGDCARVGEEKSDQKKYSVDSKKKCWRLLIGRGKSE